MRSDGRNGYLWWLGVLAIGLVVHFGWGFVNAWVNPTSAPVSGGLGAPITGGAYSQNKSGGLVVPLIRTQAFRMPSGAGVGRIMKSDANGTGTWQ